MRKSLIPTLALLAFGAGAALCFAAAPSRQPVAEIHAVWSTANWPFAMDQWGPGKAFTCTAAPGRPIQVGWMKGRSRPYFFVGSFLRQKSALTIAFNDHGDAIVATAVFDHDHDTDVESLVLNFLNDDTVVHWAKKTLGL